MSDGDLSKFYQPLVGWTVVGVGVDDSDEYDIYNCLVLQKGQQKKLAWILRDPEGNGPGFIDITTMEDK